MINLKDPIFIYRYLLKQNFIDPTEAIKVLEIELGLSEISKFFVRNLFLNSSKKCDKIY